MLGFVLAVATERLTGQGALAQLHALIPEEEGGWRACGRKGLLGECSE
jgi:hypothetical protein